MNLTEKANDHTIFSYLEMLINKKKLVMKNGSFGIVLIPPSKKWVYRIWAGDPAYDEWSKIMMKNQLNIAVPEVFKKVKTITGNFLSGTIQLKVIKMEYLHEIPIGHSVDIFDRKTKQNIRFSLSGLMTSLFSNKQEFENSFDILDEQLQLQYSDICSILNQLSNTGLESDFGVRGNLMQRQNGEYVISDPLKSFADDQVRLPTIRHKDQLAPDYTPTLRKILRIKSNIALHQAIEKYDFSEEEIKQVMSDLIINPELQMQLRLKYPNIAPKYDYLGDISIDDLEDFMFR